VSEDAAFIDAIRPRPEDETARLVYADWLDDRSDSRAEYLRAEAAWCALPPSDEQYRPLYRRISQFAAALDPAWFAAVSRMSHLVRLAWEPISEGFKPISAADDLPHAWGEAVRRQREFLASRGMREAERRFCVPADYVAYICTFGGQSGHRTDLSPPRAISVSAEKSAAGWSPQAGGNAGMPEPPEVWLDVGFWSDKHAYYVCCDVESPLFGIVMDGCEADPSFWWSMWRPDAGYFGYKGRNFLHFLTAYLPLCRRGEAREQWPRVPPSDWATC
jgi:uncharacterized protein (TIGR02996 family)